jgi:hypothetical protein
VIAVRIDLANQASAAVDRVQGVLSPSRLAPVMGRAARNVYVDHLRRKNADSPNQLGGKRTNYYLGAARATNFRAVDDGVLISIPHVGIAQRYFGGVIRAKPRKFLAFPVHPDAHGKRPREFPGLSLIFGRDGEPIGLMRARLRPRKRGMVGPPVPEPFGEILFRLTKEVNQAPDPSVLPQPLEVGAGVFSAVNDAVALAWARKNGGSSS